MTDTVLDSLDERQSKAVVLLVLSKAFASIDHSLSLLKLGSPGVSSSAIDWFTWEESDRAHHIGPVSLLLAASKVCERTCCLRPAICRLSVHQSGNKAQHSTETLKILMTDTVLDSLDERQSKAVVLLVLSKAFASIDHSLLLLKLGSPGVSSNAIDWFTWEESDRAHHIGPVSLLLAASKVCERTCCLRPAICRLSVHQSGNKAQHSTETLKILITDTVLESMD